MGIGWRGLLYLKRTSKFHTSDSGCALVLRRDLEYWMIGEMIMIMMTMIMIMITMVKNWWLWSWWWCSIHTADDIFCRRADDGALLCAKVRKQTLKSKCRELPSCICRIYYIGPMCHIICHVSIVCHYFVRLGYFLLLTDITQRLTPVRAKRMAILRQNDRCGCNHINDQELTFEYTDYLHLHLHLSGILAVFWPDGI